MVEKVPHLSDLFETGTLIKLSLGEDAEIELWLEKPATVQQDDAINKAKAKRARVMVAHRDEKSDEFVALDAEMKGMSRDALTDQLLQIKDDDFRKQATSEVLYGDQGTDWGEQGEDYIDLLDAVNQRIIEIREHNDSLTEDDSHLIILAGKDEELLRLEEVSKKFGAEVDERRQVLADGETALLGNAETEELRERVHESRVELDAHLAWFQEYRMRMLYYSVRYPGKHEKRYFDNMDQLMQLPGWVQQALLGQYDEFETGGESTKKLLSLLSSSDLSEPSKELVVTSPPSGPKE